jgi:hypothetical protein
MLVFDTVPPAATMKYWSTVTGTGRKNFTLVATTS